MTGSAAERLTRVVVLAKAPVPGRSKTRLTPPYTPHQAAAIARACLHDTLATVRILAATEPGWDLVLCLDGDPPPWLPSNVRIVGQRMGGHDARIAGGFEDCVRPAGAAPADAVVLVGMDTPQISADHLRLARDHLTAGRASFGLAADGGWWLLGMPAPFAAAAGKLVLGVPTSTPYTGNLQVDRLRRHGLRVGLLPLLRDIDTAGDLGAVVDEMVVRAVSGHLVRLLRRLRDEDAA